MEKYLKPTATIDCDNSSLQEKARDLTKGQEEIIEKAKSLFYFVRDEIKYNPYLPKYLPEHFRASNTLFRGEGYCVQKAVLLIALARAVDIPARPGFAKIRNHLMPKKLAEWMGINVFLYHGYAGLYIEGKCVKATPAFDLRMCQENRIIPVEVDGKSNAIFHSHNQDGKLHIEYIMDRGYYGDVPLDEMREVISSTFGTRFWNQVYCLAKNDFC
jgi:hypothetical protein